jgi:hypothetical protein
MVMASHGLRLTRRNTLLCMVTSSRSGFQRLHVWVAAAVFFGLALAFRGLGRVAHVIGGAGQSAAG